MTRTQQCRDAHQVCRCTTETGAQSTRHSTQKTKPVTSCDTNVTHKKGKSVTVTFTMYAQVFRENPNDTFTAYDFVDRFHVKSGAAQERMGG